MKWWHGLREPPRSGMLANIVKSRRFEGLCVSVILANAISTAWTVNKQMQEVDSIDTRNIAVAEYLFLAFYTSEIVLKVAVSGLFFFVGADARWNIFDFALVVGGALDFIWE